MSIDTTRFEQIEMFPECTNIISNSDAGFQHAYEQFWEEGDYIEKADGLRV
ncbi:hypothetical protein IC620_15445 [Hazenella sp. IB182357]|uniref:Uncharacterized protein n=1 Tax=Polycladospora coralii TaxID=2771432 RepID=A0A926RUA7_9BACL|nr:hypothetical protein [Polycladospora coralii]MBD1373740.1 hypothetical protein [Polycladospora coralii]